MGAYDWVCGWLLLGDCFTQAASLNCKWLHGKAQSASWRKSCPCPWRYVEAPPWKLWVIHRLNWTFQNSCSNAWRKFLPWNRLRNCLALLLASIRCFWRMRIPSIGMNPVVTTFAPKSWMLLSNYGSSQRPREVLSDYWTYGRYEANTSPQMLGQFLCIFDSIIFPTVFFFKIQTWFFTSSLHGKHVTQLGWCLDHKAPRMSSIMNWRPLVLKCCSLWRIPIAL